MINYESLVKSTSAYKIFKGELDGGKLSHAYLVLSSDVKNLKRYLKVFATEIAVKGLSDVDGVRAKRLIDENNHPSHTAEGALCNNLAVCDGYAKAFELMCAEA